MDKNSVDEAKTSAIQSAESAPRSADASRELSASPSLRERAKAAFIERQQRETAEDADRAEQAFTQARTRLLKKLKEILGIEDAVVVGDSRYTASTEIDGLTFVQDSHDGWFTLYLLGECPDCHSEQKASVLSLSKLGELIAEFTPDYHGYNCPPITEPSAPPPTPETELLDALRNFVRSETYSSEAV